MLPTKAHIGTFEGEALRKAHRQATPAHSLAQDLMSAFATVAFFAAVSFLLLGFVYPGLPA